MSQKRKHLDVHLLEINKQFIAIKDDDFKKSQEVFKGVFEQVKEMMGQQCNFFKKYSNQVLYGGSVYDGIKVSKMDEFDMDIVIRLPINYGDGENGIIIENDMPGFVKLKITNEFDHLIQQQHWEQCHKVTRDWRDAEKYFLQNKFRQWMHRVVQKAINALNSKVVVHESTYLLKYRESGPAFTLNITNDNGNEPFHLDVDLVPVIRFQLPRWPQGYRVVEGSQLKDWLVVPKPNKLAEDKTIKSRCWRLSFQEFEREMIKGCQQLKTTIRLVKKLRDSLEMKCIASYYIKTLFLWKVHVEKDKIFWQQKISVLLLIMIKELYSSIQNKTIAYFWQEENNLIEKLKPTVLCVYAKQLGDVIDSIETNNAERVVQHLLRKDELFEFQGTESYKNIFLVQNCSLNQQISESNLVSGNDSIDSIGHVLEEPVVKCTVSDEADIKQILKSIQEDFVQPVFTKLDLLFDRVETISEKVTKIEMYQKSLDTKMMMLEMSNKHISEELKTICDVKCSITQLENKVKTLGVKCSNNSLRNTKNINIGKQNIQNLAKELDNIRETIKHIDKSEKQSTKLKKTTDNLFQVDSLSSSLESLSDKIEELNMRITDDGKILALDF